MLAAALALAPLLARWIPDIVGWLGGDDAEEVASTVVGAVQAVAGSGDPAVMAAALQDPSKASEIAIGLARIAAEREAKRLDAQTSEIVARLKDVADARAQTVALARKGSRLAWMPAIITFVLLFVFGFVLWFVFTGTIPDQNTRMADQLIGGLYTLVTTAVSYWVGTSRGAVEMRQGLESAAHGNPPAPNVLPAAPAASARRLFGRG
jgi:amino acid transporter